MDPPSSAEKKPCKRMAKKQPLSSLSLLFPTQKGQNFRPDLREARFDKGSSFPQNVFLASGFAASP